MEKITEAKKIILSGDISIERRIRALFFLRNVDGEVSAPIIAEALRQERESILLRHECAYVLGQLVNISTIPVLLDILNDRSNDEITRHECAEAIGNFPENNFCIKNLEALLENHALEIPVRESIELALENMREEFTEEMKSPYFESNDPAKPFLNKNIEELEQIFLNGEHKLYDRYKALFALRNLNSEQAVHILAKGLENERSDLLKHEIAFVFGQMEHPASIDALRRTMKRDEHDMVLHEAAEALGAIGNEEAIEILREYENSSIRVVRESVLVALDIYRCQRENREYCTL